MTEQPRIDEEYEPADIDPDNPIETSATDREPPVEADPADWADQQIVVAGDPEEDEPLADEE